MVLEVLATAIRKTSKMHTDQLGRKNETVPIYRRHENPKESMENTKTRRSEFSKVAGYKINTQKSVTVLYTNMWKPKLNPNTIYNQCTIK